MTQNIKLYLVRHGETYFNTCQKIQGWSDSLLTKAGVNQAVILGDGLKNLPFSKVYSSDLGRAKGTADIVLSVRHDKMMDELEIVPNFREQFFGSFEGDHLNMLSQLFEDDNKLLSSVVNDSELAKFKSEDDIMNQFKLVDPTHEAENASEFWKRVDQGFNYVYSKAHDGDQILIITHGALIRKLATRVTGTYHQNPDNASLSIFEMDETKCMKLVSYDQLVSKKSSL
ncbi:MAG: histidine phosphatase family protein [Leuconostoc pseudomesenteroides]|uniref:histidine phosphatase family protein n=1 Tax=Leuconostoc pseudomesenteroides TaxID=33968 RepID=UPI001E38C845|nr:histidine phosphatase family protein [Leuconostoc pseudomesenteroides]MCC7669513.1 histidine phosphatase family protein [Leuconostoc pseudomesenteroides]